MPRTVYVCRTVDKTVPPRSNNYSSISTTCSANYPQMEHLDCDVNDNNRTAVHTELQVHKIHWFGFGTWAVNMSSMTLDQLEHITFLHHHLSDNYQNISFFYRTVRGWNCLPDDAVHTLLPFPGVATIMSKSQCRNEEPETFVSVFTARCTLVQSAVLRSHVVCLSVCLSACLSVTLVNCDHIGWNSSKIISPLVSLGRSLFATPT